jgi:hydroxyacylglutathione hydrolase
MEVRGFTVGPLAENCWFARGEGSDRLVVIDPGEEAERLQREIEELGASVEAILLTHTHFDHIGAVAPLARATGAPVYCPELEVGILADVMRYMRFPGIEIESYDADETLSGGERLRLAGLDVDVIFTPGHSPGHLSFSIADELVLFSGDVLFQGSIGRTDLPGADTATLMRSIAGLLETLPDDTRVCPGHMGVTTLGAERRGNPFLQTLV